MFDLQNALFVHEEDGDNDAFDFMVHENLAPIGPEFTHTVGLKKYSGQVYVKNESNIEVESTFYLYLMEGATTITVYEMVQEGGSFDEDDDEQNDHAMESIQSKELKKQALHAIKHEEAFATRHGQEDVDERGIHELCENLFANQEIFKNASATFKNTHSNSNRWGKCCHFKGKEAGWVSYATRDITIQFPVGRSDKELMFASGDDIFKWTCVELEDQIFTNGDKPKVIKTHSWQYADNRKLWQGCNADYADDLGLIKEAENLLNLLKQDQGVC